MRQKKRRPTGKRPAQPKSPLLTLWEQWTHQNPRPPLDRWLRSHLRSLPLNGQWTTVMISRALLEGVRYQQLACALEDIHTGRASLAWQDSDWQTWDEQWQEFRLSRFQANTCWSWIERRTRQSWGFARQQRDDAERSRIVQALEHKAQQQPLSPLGMLWLGLRPGWIQLLRERARLSHWSDAQLLNFAEQQNQQPPLWLRVNPLRRNRLSEPDEQAALQQMLQSLREAEINASLEGGYLNARGGKGIESSELYRSGQLEIQDLASQQIAAALEPQPGDKIWDACAGAGGKTLALAGAMNNKGALVATDLQQYKLNELKRRASRAGANNVRTFVWNGEEALRLPQEIERHGGFDKVLVDAPCSSAGTWRRNPDARWRFSASDTAELNELQQRLLTLASAAVRSGGRLVYATCSWAVAENEDIVTAFLSDNPEFRCHDMRLLGMPERDSDTMFVAVLEKR